MTPRLLELCTNLSPDRARLTHKRWGNPYFGEGQPALTGKAGAEGLAHTDAPNMIRGSTWEKSNAILIKTGSGKTAAVLCDGAANAFMTTHARALPVPDATVPLGIGEVGPAV